jgi:hypothetical protein
VLGVTSALALLHDRVRRRWLQRSLEPQHVGSQLALTRTLVNQVRYRAGLPNCVKKLRKSWEPVELLMPRARLDVLFGSRTLKENLSIT